ncbi:MAG: N-acetyltransferase [Gemmatimonadota bacterium]
MPPAVVVHSDAASFLARARAWLMEREDEHNLVLGLATTLSNTPPPAGPEGYFFATVEEEGAVSGAAFRTPPNKVGVTRMPLAAGEGVARALAERYDRVPAVFGHADVAEAVAAAWVRLKGGTARTGLPQRIYRLDRVTFPEGVAGTMRAATEADLPTVHLWGEGFAEDAGRAFATAPETRARWVAVGSLFLWEDGGEPVSMALATGRTENGVRIGYVYTPPERRGRGYASALTAALSQRELDRGARFCVLYTDLGNPVSNRIYQRLGYRPLHDLLDVDIEAVR